MFQSFSAVIKVLKYGTLGAFTALAVVEAGGNRRLRGGTPCYPTLSDAEKEYCTNILYFNNAITGANPEEIMQAQLSCWSKMEQEQAAKETDKPLITNCMISDLAPGEMVDLAQAFCVRPDHDQHLGKEHVTCPAGH